MTWIAAHQTPTGFLARYTHASREAAAMALYTALSNVRGGREARQRLVASAADFIAEIDGHWFSLSSGDAQCGLAATSGAPVTARDVSSLVQNFPLGAPNTERAFSNDTSIAEPSLPNTYGAGK